MAEADRPAWADLREEGGRLAADLAESVRLRWELARLEIQASWSACKRLIVGLILAAVLGLAGLPILVVAAAEWLTDRWGIPRWGWLVTFGLLLLATAATLAGAAWRGFRRRFVGLEQTMEELREDLRWIEEWVGGRD